jgi:hypothetical protein
MGWIREHLIIVYGVGVAILVLTGAILVSNKFATNTRADPYTWGSYGDAGRFIPTDAFGGSLRNPQPLDERFTVSDLYRNLETNPDRVYASLTPGIDAPSSFTLFDATTTPEGIFEFGEGAIDALLASIQPSAYTGNLTATEGLDLDSVYSYIPSSISSATTTLDQPMSKEQNDLYHYGNDAGSPIELYGSLWGSVQSNIHRSFVEDYTNQDKAASLERLAEAVFEVGLSIQRLNQVPDTIQEKNKDLADAYKDIARKTLAISKITTEADLLVALDEYNASADKFLKTYLAIVTTFSLNGITYDDNEPGRVFVYTASSGF